MKKLWLGTFNVVTLIAWSLFFFHALLHGLAFDRQSLLMLAVAQGLAIFEIMNAVLGMAGANWLLTTVQVLSRFMIVGLFFWIPDERLIEISSHSIVTGFALISIAWSITEIVRALYYLVGIAKKEIKAITFCRYSFFIVLYPMGVLGEFLVMFTFWEWRDFAFDPINITLAIIALSYFVGFPKLYGHMLKQRRKKLGRRPA